MSRATEREPRVTEREPRVTERELRVTERVAGADVRHEPFTYAVIDDLPGAGWSAELSEAFPTSGFRSTGTAGADDFFFFRRLFRGGTLVADGLARTWLDFAAVLQSDEYRAAVSRRLGVSLAGCQLVAGFCVYGAGRGLLPHTDRELRVVTQTLYLTRAWQPSWGGGLRVLGSPDPQDIRCEVAPTLGRSMLFRRSDDSWHAVGPVTADAGAPRRSLLLHFSTGDA
jgi:SM-20-related protein